MNNLINRVTELQKNVNLVAENRAMTLEELTHRLTQIVDILAVLVTKQPAPNAADSGAIESNDDESEDDQPALILANEPYRKPVFVTSKDEDEYEEDSLDDGDRAYDSWKDDGRFND